MAYCDLHVPVSASPVEIERRGPKPGWSPHPIVGGSQDDGSASFDVAEFAVLDDGRRVLLHDERGFTLGGGPQGDPWSGLTKEILEGAVLTTVLPDDDDAEDEHPYEWLAELCRLRGVHVTAEQLRRVPYVVELSEPIMERLARRSPGGA